MKLKVGVSNRHIHLTKEDKDILFGKDYELQKRNDLVQTGEYACNETVTLENNGNLLEHVRIIGPLRSYTQVEILNKDKEVLKINPPIRDSGDLVNSEDITIIGTTGKIHKKSCCIVPNTHIHINNNDNIGYNNGDIVKVKTINNQIIDNVHIKQKDNYVLEFQINKDDALKYNLETGDYVELE